MTKEEFIEKHQKGGLIQKICDKNYEEISRDLKELLKAVASEAWDDGFDWGIHYDCADSRDKSVLKQLDLKKYD